MGVPVRQLTTIGFDADDTLWHNERFFKLTQSHFIELLANHAEPEHLSTRLLEAEKRNIGHYGFGIKGFTLSMIETAIEVTKGKVPAEIIAEILEAGREMLTHPVEILPHVEQVLTTLSDNYQLLLITKGDLIDQERKIAQSGLGEFFHAIEIVSDKNTATYTQVFSRHAAGPNTAMMVGNSLKSDVIPAIQAGSWGVYVPHEHTWALEHETLPENSVRFRQIDHLKQLTDLIAGIDNAISKTTHGSHDG